MVAAFFGSGFFQVGPSEKAVILRFGRPVGEGQKALLSAGLHWSLPYPIDEVVKIPIAARQTVTSNNGWYFTTPEQELSGEEMPAGPSLNPAVDGYIITADRNIVHSRATLSYHIADPIRYVFDFAAASNAVQNVADNALLYTAAHYNVDDVLTRDVKGFQDAVKQRADDLAEQEKLGIVIDQCEVQSRAPRQLQSIFDQVGIASENRNKALLEAHSHENKVLSEASAQASSITNRAESARVSYVESINADAKAFSELLPQYEKNPALFAQLQLVEVMGRSLTNLHDSWLEPTAGGGTSIENRLMLNREPTQPKPGAAP